MCYLCPCARYPIHAIHAIRASWVPKWTTEQRRRTVALMAHLPLQNEAQSQPLPANGSTWCCADAAATINERTTRRSIGKVLLER